MELDEYLWRNKISKKYFAEKVRLAPHTLSNIVFKKVTPNLISALNIVKASEGQVTFEELVKDSDKENLINIGNA